MKKGSDGKTAYLWLVRADVMYRAKSRLANLPNIEEEQAQDFIGYAKKCGVELK